MKDKPLTQKEKLFCTYYSVKQNAFEAAIKAGYTTFPERTAIKLLKRENINKYITKLTLSNAGTAKEVAAGFKRLAFGCINDAVNLAFKEDVDPQMLREMDLFSVSEIKVTKGKSVEIKFFDRIKALEKLSQIIGENDKNETNGFFEAIKQGAKAIARGDSDG